MEIKIVNGGSNDRRVFSLHSNDILKPETIRVGQKHFAVFARNTNRVADSSILVYKYDSTKAFDQNNKDAIYSLGIREFVPLNIDMDFFDLNYFFQVLEIETN